MKSNRISWVDISKGLLIFLMVLAHTPGFYVKWIYAFHMAAFFILSGYTTDYKKYKLLDYIVKKFKSLIIPFFTCNIVFLSIHFLLSLIGKYDVYYLTSFTSLNIKNLFKYLWTTDLGGATWFLIVLFFASILGKIIDDLLNNSVKKKNDITKYKIIIALLMVIVNYILFYQSGESLQFYIDLIPMAFLFITLGNELKKIKIDYSSKLYIALSIGSIIFYIWYCHFNYFHVEWVIRHFPNLLIMLAISFSGFMIIHNISVLLDKWIKNDKYNVFKYIGKNTLPIMMYHFLGFRIFYTLLYVLGFASSDQLKSLIPLYGDNVILCLATCIFAIVFSIVMNFIVEYIIKYFKSHNLFDNKIISICIIVICSYLSLAWTLSSRNYFLLDDWNNLVRLPYINFSDFLSILPTDVYCSRPGGWFVVKIILNLFGKNYFMHAFSMIFIHAVNSILMYLILNKIFKNKEKKNFISLFGTFIFALYPISSFAAFWEAGMFDLFGLTLSFVSLLSFLLYKESDSKIKKIIFTVIMILSYYCSIRTKEMFLLLPACYFVFNALEYCVNKTIKEIFSKNRIKEFLIDNINILLMIVIMFAYYFYNSSLTNSNSVTVNENDPYYYSFNLIILIKNLFNYLYAYFNLDSMVYGNFSNIVNFSNLYKLTIITSSISVLVYSVYRFFKQKDNIMISLIVFFVFIILPVLPMKNMQHVLYLYAPSVFIATILSYLLSLAINVKNENYKYIIITEIVFLLFIGFASPIQNFRNWWLDTATTDHNTYNYFYNMKTNGEEYEKIYIINVPEVGYTSFWNGNGYIVKVAFDNPDQEVYINKDDYNLKDKKQLVIDFNNYDFKILTK